MGVITFNGTASTIFNINVEKCPSYPVPQRVVQKISVMGRSGDLIYDTGAYSNIEQRYEIYYDGRSSSFQAKSREIVNWLYGTKGYCRLEDTYDPDVYRMACVSQKTDFRNFFNIMGRATLVFDCKPQRWLKSGESEVALTIGATGQSITNSYRDCAPIFKLTGNGTLQVNASSIVVSNNSGTVIEIDCETQNAYNGVNNLNSKMALTGDFPYLKTGTNVVKVTGFSAAKMIPRWWTL